MTAGGVLLGKGASDGRSVRAVVWWFSSVGSECDNLPGAGFGMGKAVGVRAGLDDGRVEGGPVDDGRAEPWICERLRPSKWGWHLFPARSLPCHLAVGGSWASL